MIVNLVFLQRGIVGEIIKRFEQRGYKLIAMKFMHASRPHLEVRLEGMSLRRRFLFSQEHYRDLKDKKFFPDLIAYMASGPVVPMVWEGLDAVKQGRAMLGTTNPLQSAPGSIRGDFRCELFP